MSYDYTINLKIKDFKRLFSALIDQEKPNKTDTDLAMKLKFIIENLEEEERIMNEDDE